MTNQALTDNELDIVFRKISGERKERAFFMRKHVKKYMDKLSGMMPDAMEHIGLAQYVYELPQGVKTANWLAVSRGAPKDDLNPFYLDLKVRYEAWRLSMQNAQVALSITENICQMDESLEALRKRERISYLTAEKLFHYGLNEFCIASGWGDQINLPSTQSETQEFSGEQ